MPKGSSSRSGPAPDPNALRRDRKDDASGWVDLPVEGRDGPPPEWPLSRPTKRELELWEAEWRRPQAVMWERNGQALEVALYVRSVRDAERPAAAVSSRTLVRQQMDALGLTVPGLRANRWKIGGQSDSAGRRPEVRRRPSPRDRLKVVDGSG